eukprot:m.105404 g.105404  ORF g.105404 m.105404 type:complete len:320 (+) comp13873_c1_seq1:954-1913(+)
MSTCEALRSMVCMISRLVLWLPVILVHMLVFWSQWVFNNVISDRIFREPQNQLFILVLCNLVLILMMWSYWRTIMTRVKSIPTDFKLDALELRSLMDEETVPESVSVRKLPIKTRNSEGGLKFCTRCRGLKPDRAHHCSICGTCVLKMDHHCPWVNNCVGFHNYKFFCLFLFWTMVYITILVATSLKWFLLFIKGGDLDIGDEGLTMEAISLPLLFIIAIVFGFSVSALGFFHTYLTLRNKTTIDSFRDENFVKPTKRGWDLGWRDNFKSVFGKKPLYWLIPVPSKTGDGVNFPVLTNMNEQILLKASETLLEELEELV